MKLTSAHLVRAAPIALVNLIPLAGVVEYGWPVIALFILYFAETWVLVILDALRMAAAPLYAPRRGSTLERAEERIDYLGEGLMWFIIGSLFVLFFLFAAIHTLGVDFMRHAEGYLLSDFLRYVDSLGLPVPIAMIALAHATLFLRDAALDRKAGRQVTERGGISFLRLFALLALFLLALGPTMLMRGSQSWALVVVVVVKAGFDIWVREMQHETEQRQARSEEQDPRGRGSWPRPPATPG